MPVPAKIGRVERDDDHVPDTDADVVVAAGAVIRLQRLVRLDSPYLDAYLGIRTHSRRMATTTNAAATIT